MFWSDNLQTLFNEEKLGDFIPRLNMTYAEQLNALVRFSIYFGLILFIYYRESNALFIPIITMILTYVLYINYQPDKDKIKQEQIIEQVGAGGLSKEEQTEVLSRYVLDSDNKLCQTPTKENPFMNVLLSDYVDQPNRPEACPYDSKQTQEEVEKNFNAGLFRELDDLWDRNNSQRQFYTMPSTTIPNDRDAFMNFCYRPKYVCKDGDLSKCLKTERLGFQLG